MSQAWIWPKYFALLSTAKPISGMSTPLQQVQIAVARRVHQSLDRAPVLLIVEDERRVRLVPVPRLVPLVLEVARHLARVGLDGDGGRGVKVVPRALIPEPGRSVSGAP